MSNQFLNVNANSEIFNATESGGNFSKVSETSRNYDPHSGANNDQSKLWNHFLKVKENYNFHYTIWNEFLSKI